MIRILPLLLLLAYGGSSTVAGQVASPEADRDRAIALVNNNPAEAITLLNSVLKRNKKDVRAWHWLGKAFEKHHQPDAGAKAHETAANTAYQIQTATDGGRSLSKTELLEAADSVDRLLSLKPSLSNKKKKEWHDRGTFLRLVASSSAADSVTYKGTEVTEKVRVLSKPEPSFTEDARKNLVTGTVVLRCVFGADGRVRNIVVIRALPEGLTERAIEAAKQIKFIPAMKDGKPVSMWMQLEYNFLFGL